MALAATLRHCTRVRGSGPCKIVVFMSSCDAVEFHHQLLRDALPGLGFDEDDEAPLLSCPIWKLHGNLAQVCTLDAMMSDALLMQILHHLPLKLQGWASGSYQCSEAVSRHRLGMMIMLHRKLRFHCKMWVYCHVAAAV